MRHPKLSLALIQSLMILILSSCSPQLSARPPQITDATATAFESPQPLSTLTPEPYPYPTTVEPWNPYPYPWTYSPPTRTPGPSPTSFPSLTPIPSPTFVPTPTGYTPMMVNRLEPADIQSMAAWNEIGSGEGFKVYKLSQARLGVNRSEWSLDGGHVMLQVNTGNFELGPWSQSLPIIVDIHTQAAWSTYVNEGDFCYESYDWSPDGRHLLSQELDPLGRYPAWSPDSRLIAYWKVETDAGAERYSLWLVDVLTLQYTQLLEPVEENPSGDWYQWTYDITPNWSPDGHSISFISNQLGDPQAFVIQFEPGYPLR